MQVTRRSFLKYCAASATALGLTPSMMKDLEAALASDGAPTLIWLHGSGCQGDSISFLNLFTMVPEVDPVKELTVGRVLIEAVNLAYHTVVMSSAGTTAVTMAEQAKRKGGYVLVCEGGVPTAFEGKACNIMTVDDQEVTYQQAVVDLAANAAAVVCVGTCACYGGIPRSVYPQAPLPASEPSGPTGVLSVKEAIASTGKGVINIPGCPAHPDWIAWAVIQLILGNAVELDPYDRPTALFGNKDLSMDMNVHENCPRNVNKGDVDFATTFGQDLKCLEHLGCRGPNTFSDCPTRKWHNGENGPVSWCVDCNGMCFGCVEPDFPGGNFYA